ncbi:MAG: acetoin utilization protein AcuB [Desulforhopalus sp.]|jgi:acetoin utilization protein AcuB
MFYVTDIDGLKFKGPLEQLDNWRTVSRKTIIKPIDEEKNSSTLPKGPGATAIAAYQKVIANDNMVEPLVHVHQIMSSPPSTISPQAPLTEAWGVLQNLNLRQLIVTTEKKEIVGLLSDKNILSRINIIDNEVKVEQELLVEDVIKKEFVSTDSISDIRRVAMVLAQFHIDAMPVLEEERLVGIVTRGDILRGFAANPKLNLWA